MRTKRFNAFEEELSVIGYGCWGLSGGDIWTGGEDAEGVNAVIRAIELGVNFFDVAPVYGFGHAETILGKAIKGHRDDILIATKCGLVWDGALRIANDLSKESIFKEIDESLRRIGTDYIDLYQLHWPDPNTEFEEPLEALDQLRKAGKIRYIGLTNFAVQDCEIARRKIGLSSIQGLYNLLEHNPKSYHGIPLDYRTRKELLPYCEQFGIPFLPYSPLMQGLLTAHFDPTEWAEADVRQSNPKFHGEVGKIYRDLARKVRELASDLEKPVAQVALNWLVYQSSVGPVICGGIRPEHVDENAASVTWDLPNDEFSRLDQLVTQTLEEMQVD